MMKRYRVPTFLLLLWVAPAAALSAPAPPAAVPAPTSPSPVSALYNFGSRPNDGVAPNVISRIAEGPDGTLYSTTPSGGAYGKGTNGFGTAYKITPEGVLTFIYNFDGVHGAYPQSGLTRGGDGNFYGTTNGGGKYAAGTIFKITADGQLTDLYDFRNGAVVPRPVGRPPTEQETLDAVGSYPLSGPVPGNDGSLYGVVPTGNIQRDGILYRISPAGDFHALHNFHSEAVDDPGGLIMGADGNLYGITLTGTGANRYGTVFRATTDGAVTVLYHFDSTHGALPYDLIQGRDGSLYGTAKLAGPGGRGVIYKLTLAGEMTVLHAFNGTDGGNPIASVVQGKDGNLYGVTSFYGSYRVRTISGDFYRLHTDGTGFTILHNFGGASGAFPSGALIQHTNGKFYGTTGGGGTGNGGVFYGLDPSVLQVTDVRLGLPQVVTSGRSRTLVQPVYVLGTGKGPVSGQWLLDNQSAQVLPATVVDLAAGNWVRLGAFHQVLTGHHSLLFAVGGANAPRTGSEDVAITGFIPSLDGWPFPNDQGRMLPGVLFLPYKGAAALAAALKTAWMGECEGFSISARDYYNHPTMTPTRPPDRHETIAVAQLIAQDQDDGNAASKDARVDWQAALGYPFNPAAYKLALQGEAVLIEHQIQSGDPCVMDLFPLQTAPSASLAAHAVVGNASFYATNVLVMRGDGSQTEVQTMTYFAIYDPNDPGNDQRYVGAFDTGGEVPNFEFIPLPPFLTEFYPTLKMWLPSTFHTPR